MESTSDEVVTSCSCCGMITTRSGSTPRRHRPSSAASSGNISQVGSSCPRFLISTSGHRRRRTSCTSDRSIPSWETITIALRSPPIIPANRTSRHGFLRRATRSRTSRIARRRCRAALGKPTDEPIDRMARLDVASAQSHIPTHHPWIIARRHHVHAADWQENAPPVAMMPGSMCRHAAAKTCRQIRLIDREQGTDDRLLLGVRQLHLALCGHPGHLRTYLCGADF